MKIIVVKFVQIVKMGLPSVSVKRESVKRERKNKKEKLFYFDLKILINVFLKKFLFYFFLLLLFSAIAFLVFSFFQKKSQQKKELKIKPAEIITELKLTSSAFENNTQIPVKYTCDGDDINPPLKIEGQAEEVKSLALIVDDPDAPIGTFTHWLVWNISPQIREIKENSVPERAIEGRNDFAKIGYGGPCPPRGSSHRYFFNLYALDTELNLERGANKKELEMVMSGHILGQTSLIGLYQR